MLGDRMLLSENLNSMALKWLLTRGGTIGSATLEKDHVGLIVWQFMDDFCPTRGFLRSDACLVELSLVFVDRFYIMFEVGQCAFQSSTSVDPICMLMQRRKQQQKKKQEEEVVP